MLLEMLIDPAVFVMALIWAAHGFLIMMALKAGLSRAPVRGRIALFFLLPIGAALVQTALDLTGVVLFGSKFLANIADQPFGMVVSPLAIALSTAFKVSLRSYLWIYGLYAAAVALRMSAQGEFEAREEGYAAQVQAQRAELDALRLQVNPHFLFNALNSVASLAGDGQMRQTEQMALNLARYYRSTFIDMDRDVVLLGDELDTVQAYLEMETHRLEKLAFVLDCPQEVLGAKLPPMILQPLVENAVKYGVAGHDRPRPILITARRQGGHLQLSCESGISPDPDPPGAGTGLTTVRRRLANVFGDRAALVLENTDGGWRANITVPLTIAGANTGAERADART